jgi:ABC-type bacteriocin/lantibiotic exporter with double-glycine peptidase domain
MMNKLKTMKMSTLVIAMVASNAIHGIMTTLINKNEAAIVHGFTNKIFITLLIGYLMVIFLNFVDKFIYGAFKTREINNQHIKILERVTGSKMSDIQQIASGKIFDTAKDIAATMAMMKVSMATMLYSTIPFVFLIMKEIKAAPAAAVVSLTSIPLSVGLILALEKKLKFTEEQKKKKSVMQGITADNFVNIRTIKYLGISKYAVSRLKNAQDDAWELSINPKQVYFFRLIDAICIAPLLINAYICRNNLELLALIIVSNSVIDYFRGVLIDIGSFIVDLKASYSIIENLKNDDDENRVKLNDDIVLEDVFFDYGKDTIKFNIPYLRIKKGSKTMVVGESGEGKSSLANLLAGGIKPTTGIVPAYDTFYIWQETESLDDTLWNNIVFDNPYGLSESDVLRYFDKLNLTDWFMELKEGFNTNIGEHGCKLSSGQKQRVNIIRAVIEMRHNPDRLFILDEITSNLDDATREAAIKLFEDVMCDDMTVIFITHNEGFDAICDNKIVVKDHRFITDNIKHQKYDEWIVGTVTK